MAPTAICCTGFCRPLPTAAAMPTGDINGRLRLALEIAEHVRTTWPPGKPLFFRISAVDGRPYCSEARPSSSPLPAQPWSIRIWALQAARALGVDPGFKLWPPSYG